jgi:hypothetical protein
MNQARSWTPAGNRCKINVNNVIGTGKAYASEKSRQNTPLPASLLRDATAASLMRNQCDGLPNRTDYNDYTYSALSKGAKLA